MSRYYWSFLFTVIAAVGAWVLLHGAIRWWMVNSVLLAHVILIICGVAFIRMQLYVPAFCHGDRAAKEIALTFDDGPDPEITPALLKLLKEENVTATFFLVGRRVSDHPELARRIAEDGHLVGNHTYLHQWWTNLMLPWVLEREIARTQAAIEQATGEEVALMRPPMGLTNPWYRRVLAKHRLKMVGWDVRPFDGYRSVRDVIERVSRNARGGSIIVLHDGSAGRDVLEITRAVIHELRGRGFEFVPIDEMIEGKENARLNLEREEPSPQPIVPKP
jgi:peptidoglycan-N-acetylglucosamine deacetylase